LLGDGGGAKAALTRRTMVLDLKSVMPDASPADHWRDPTFVHQFLLNVRGSVPLAIEQIDVVLRLIAAACDRVQSFLILGGGDSLLASAILEEHPQARGFLIENSASGIESARRHLRAHVDRLTIVQADPSQAGWMDSLTTATRFDAVICGLDGEDVSEERKRSFYGEIFALLSPEGVFINLDYVASATRWTESEWDDQMIDAVFGEQLRGTPRNTRVEIARAYYATASRGADVPAPLEVQCDWLRETGFESVECFLKVRELAMFGGQRPARDI
jgi:phospholipid N-methyltransferase